MKYKGAIIGLGNIFINGHLPAYQKRQDIQIVAAYDALIQKKDDCCQILPQTKFYSSLDQMFLENEFDFIDIATPPFFHAELVKKGISANKHVLCEKPLILFEKDWQDIVTLKKQFQTEVVTIHNWQFSPILMQLKALLSQGCIGDVLKIKYDVIRTKPSVSVNDTKDNTNWRLDPNIAGGGILVDHGWHAFYTINDWVRGDPLWVECVLENKKYIDFPLEDTASINMGFEKAEADIFFTWAGEERKNYIRVEGTKGMVEVLDSKIVYNDNKSNKVFNFEEGLSQGSHHADWYQGVLEEFVDIINKSKENKNFADASKCFKIMQACQKSALADGAKKLMDCKNIF